MIQTSQVRSAKTCEVFNEGLAHRFNGFIFTVGDRLGDVVYLMADSLGGAVLPFFERILPGGHLRLSAMTSFGEALNRPIS
jgi:hypothetical protein